MNGIVLAHTEWRDKGKGGEARGGEGWREKVRERKRARGWGGLGVVVVAAPGEGRERNMERGETERRVRWK